MTADSFVLYEETDYDRAERELMRLSDTAAALLSVRRERDRLIDRLAGPLAAIDAVVRDLVRDHGLTPAFWREHIDRITTDPSVRARIAQTIADQPARESRPAPGELVARELTGTVRNPAPESVPDDPAANANITGGNEADATRFLDLALRALRAGRAHLSSTTDGGAPTDPERWGWRVSPDGLRPSGRHVGWLSPEGVLLKFRSASVVVSAMAREQRRRTPRLRGLPNTLCRLGLAKGTASSGTSNRFINGRTESVLVIPLEAAGIPTPDADAARAAAPSVPNAPLWLEDEKVSLDRIVEKLRRANALTGWRPAEMAQAIRVYGADMRPNEIGALIKSGSVRPGRYRPVLLIAPKRFHDLECALDSLLAEPDANASPMQQRQVATEARTANQAHDDLVARLPRKPQVSA